MKERIQKVLANVGVDSRRAVEQMVLMGRISVNGEVVTALPVMVDPAVDKIEVDGEPIRLKTPKATQKVYILMNKPKGIYCTNVAQGEQKLAIDLLPPNFPFRVYPVGRLDADSRGLLLLTNDGDLTNQLTHPRYGISKTYIAEIEGYVHGEVIDELNKGIWLADKAGHGSKTLPSHVKIVNRGRDRSTIEITIREGRNRQVRRMLAGLGHKVRRLTRVRMGRLTLQGVGPGLWRFLTPQEVRGLMRDLKRSQEGGDPYESDGGPADMGPAETPSHPSAKPAREQGGGPTGKPATSKPYKGGSHGGPAKSGPYKGGPAKSGSYRGGPRTDGPRAGGPSSRPGRSDQRGSGRGSIGSRPTGSRPAGPRSSGRGPISKRRGRGG